MLEALKRPVNWRKVCWWAFGFFVFAMTLSVVVIGSFHKSEAFRMGMDAANASPELVARIGQPVRAGLLISGALEVNEASGKADLAIPISGPNGSGTLYLAAVKRAGEWSLTELKLGADWVGDNRDHKPVNLMSH